MWKVVEKLDQFEAFSIVPAIEPKNVPNFMKISQTDRHQADMRTGGHTIDIKSIQKKNNFIVKFYK